MIQPIVSAESAPPAGPYTPAIRVGDLLFVSGQGPFDAAGKLVGDTFTAQADAVFDNIARLATAAGTDLSHAVRIGAFLRDLSDFAAWNEVCARRLSEPYPARTTVPVALPGFAVEVDAVLWIPSNG